ncbi:MAG: Ankyrin [Blastococcus sp.]|nr:Ankyrin [Blastococcus sp.]
MTTRMTVQRLGRLIAAGDVDAVRTAVQSSPGLLTRTVERGGQGGWTPLHVAVAECQADAVRALVEAGAILGARTEHHRTPLHVALEFCPDLVPLLVELGVVLDAPSAAYLGDVDQLGTLLDGGADLDDPASGQDLLSWARSAGPRRPPNCCWRGGPTPTGAPSTRRRAGPGWRWSACCSMPAPT